jgi:hypothetical protein
METMETMRQLRFDYSETLREAGMIWFVEIE